MSKNKDVKLISGMNIINRFQNIGSLAFTELFTEYCKCVQLIYVVRIKTGRKEGITNTIL